MENSTTGEQQRCEETGSWVRVRSTSWPDAALDDDMEGLYAGQGRWPGRDQGDMMDNLNNHDQGLEDPFLGHAASR